MRIFMRNHVFAVWDFQSLVKALQKILTCVEVPWLPTPEPDLRRFVNEIVLDEESDEAPNGGYCSHYELYLQAMHSCGADAEPVRRMVATLVAGASLEAALVEAEISPSARAFVAHTLAVARSNQPHRIAAAFAYGRETLIPDMFRLLVARLAGANPERWPTFVYYLNRHIDRDGARHGPSLVH